MPPFFQKWHDFLSFFLLCLFFAASGFLDAYFQTHSKTPFPNLPSNAVSVEGVLTGASLRTSPFSQTPFWRLEISDPILERGVDEGMKPLQRYFEISWRSEQKPPEIGRKIKIRTLLHLPSPPILPGGYDFQRRAYFADLGAQGRALEAPILLQSSNSGLFRKGASLWKRWREKTASHVRQALKNHDEAAVAEILLCGEEGDLSYALRSAFAASGLAHILAVAGLHLGMVSGFVAFASYFLLSRSEWLLLRCSVRNLAALSGLLAGAGYIFFTGAHVPGVRALGVAAIALLAFQFRRNAFSLRSLAFVALAFEMISPAVILTAGFQMSFCAVMALGAGYQALRPVTKWIRARGRLGVYVLLPLFTLAMTSLIAGSAVIPSVLAGFGLFQPWFILANLIAVPLMGLWVMPLTVCSLAAMLFGAEKPFLYLMSKGISGIIASANFASHLPAASVPVPLMGGFTLSIAIFGLSLLCLGQGRKRFLGIAFIFAGVAMPFLKQKPFLFFSNYGKFSAVAARDHLAVFELSKGENQSEKKRTLENWESALGLKKDSAQSFSCEGAPYCLLHVSGRPILWIEDHKIFDKNTLDRTALCEKASLSVSFTYGRKTCPDKLNLTPSLGWKEGSVTLFQKGREGIEIHSDLKERGRRPWVYPPSLSGFPNIDLAKSE